MSFFESVVQKTRKLERLLEENYQASGKGLHEKATSVADKLDSDLVKQVRFIASVRNKLMHEDGYSFDGNESEFLGKCDNVIRRLESQPSYTPPPPKPEPSYTYTPPPKPPPVPSSYSGRTSPSYAPPPRAKARDSGPPRGEVGIDPEKVGALFSSTFISLIVAAVLYPVVGLGGCIVRSGAQGSPPSPHDSAHDKWLYDPPLDAFSTEAVYIPLAVILLVMMVGVANVFKINAGIRLLFILVSFAVVGAFGKTTVDSLNIREKLAKTFSLNSGQYSSISPSSTSASNPPKPGQTPFSSRHWDAPPFTPNKNNTAPLLWSVRFAIPAHTEKCQGSEGKMWVEPNTVVFVKFVDGTSGEAMVGTPSDRRRVQKTDSWMAARFVQVGEKQYPTDIQIAKRELFVVCEATSDIILHLEARRLPR